LLLSVEQPHAPIKQVFGKSSADLQHSRVVTVPPDALHNSSVVLLFVALHMIEGIKHFGVL
jgi:hypothetical protein